MRWRCLGGDSDEAEDVEFLDANKIILPEKEISLFTLAKSPPLTPSVVLASVQYLKKLIVC